MSWIPARSWLIAAAVIVGCMLGMAHAEGTADGAKVLNVANWPEYIDLDRVHEFEKRFGIKVNYATYDTDEALESRLKAGHSGYDVVFPTSAFFARGIKDGLYQKLDKTLLPNFHNIDHWILDLLSKQADPGNLYAAPYNFGTNGYTYNVDMIRKRMKNAPTDSLQLIFDPAVLSHFENCGVSFLDSPEDVIPLALVYMGKDPTSQNPDDIKSAVDMLMKVRPYVARFDTSEYLNDLPAGKLCIAMSWSGDYATAESNAEAAHIKINLRYTIPKEGTNIWFDGMLVPKDAPHPKDAMIFINYMMEPETAAANTNYTNYATANMAAMQFVNKDILDNPAIYPDAKILANGYPSAVRNDEMYALITQEWNRFKAGQ
jgi:putrescine transport system substrate-binding protein